MQPAFDPAAALYRQIRNSSAIERSGHLENVQLRRDRVTINFMEGTIYFSAAVAGKIRSAVFIGSGTFQADPPPVGFEQDNVRRMLKADNVSSDFKVAVMRFTDDTAELLSQSAVQSSGSVDKASTLAADLEPRLLKETGMNVSARQLGSILNHENPGIFIAQMDGGKRGRFTYVFDPQSRIPVATFGINAGEKGIIFAHDDTLDSSDVWMAFHAMEDYARGQVQYSDSYNLVDTEKYSMTLDLMEPHKVLGLTAKMDLVSRVEGLRVIAFSVGEDLAIAQDERRKKQLHISRAQLADGTPLTFLQEPWESGFSVILPAEVGARRAFALTVDLKGDFMMSPEPAVPDWMLRTGTTPNTFPPMYFPRSPETWYPRHGFLPRSTFDISMIHRKKDRVVTLGELVKEGPSGDIKDAIVTEFRMDQPVPFATFALGSYEIHKDKARLDNGTDLPLEFYSMPGSQMAIKESFILAEMSNALRFFDKMFGQYPYPLFRGVFHPFGYGQGFATTIMIPAADTGNAFTHSFIAHETSHQWWGDIVAWRSYRDQWLSEGFAEYSGMLYVQSRDKPSSELTLIKNDREALKMPPRTLVGPGAGRLVDVGPLVMGYRVETRETSGAYTALTYKKGALVLRMLNFLFTDPQTGDGKPFFDLMRDFVQRYKGSTATTEQFFAMANDRVKDTPLAKKYGYRDVNWFYRQWVTQSYLPSYELSYNIDSDGGSVVLKGELSQSGLPDKENWFMPLPLVIHYPGGKVSYSTVAVQGKQTPVNIRLPERPEKVELDPDFWILSDKTSTKTR